MTHYFETRELPILKNLKPYRGGVRGIGTVSDYFMKYYSLGRPATYTKDGELQCRKGRRRSFLDMYYLCKAKFKDVTTEEVAYIYLSAVLFGIDKKYIKNLNGYKYWSEKLEYSPYLQMSYCGVVNKLVSHISWSKNHNPSIVKNKKYFRLNGLNFGANSCDDISLEDIIKMANKWIKKNNL